MYVRYDLDAFESVESRIVPADFGKLMAADEVIIQATWYLTVADDSTGEDENASDHVSIPATFSGQRTFQSISGLVDGVKYALRAVVGTDQGNTYSLWTHLSCKDPH